MEGNFALIHLLVTIVTFLGLYLLLNYMSYLATTNWDAPYTGINTSPTSLSSSPLPSPMHLHGKNNITTPKTVTRTIWKTKSPQM